MWNEFSPMSIPAKVIELFHIPAKSGPLSLLPLVASLDHHRDRSHKDARGCFSDRWSHIRGANYFIAREHAEKVRSRRSETAFFTRTS